MRYLIDGYNLMYAGGLLGRKLGPDQFRQIRTRFLNDLASALGPLEAQLTTVVFDASQAPEDIPKALSHQGISVLFAVDVESADERIEELIAHHSAPKSLTVVSSDRRLRTAASRRKATAMTAELFLVSLDERRKQRKNPSTNRPPTPPRDARLSEAESAFWVREFADLDALPETRAALGNSASSMLTDADIAAIEREIERERERD